MPLSGSDWDYADRPGHVQITTINALFDRVDERTEARNRFTSVAPLGPDDDPVRDAEVLLQHAELVNQALAGVRSAAVDASVHRRRNDLAADVSTKANLLFRRDRPYGGGHTSLMARRAAAADTS